MIKKIESIEFCGIKLNEFRTCYDNTLYTGTIQGKYAVTFPLDFILSNLDLFVIKWVTRKPGFYWVKQHGHEDLEIAKLEPNYFEDGVDRWFITGHLYTLRDSDLSFVSNKPIKYEGNEENC